MQMKKKVLHVFISNFETYTKYSYVADEAQKSGLSVFKWKFLSSLVGRNNSLFKLFKGGYLKKKYCKLVF